MTDLQLVVWDPPSFAGTGNEVYRQAKAPEDLGFTIISTVGLGLPPIRNFGTELRMGDGGIYRGSRAQQRVVSLGVQFLQDTFLEEQEAIAELVTMLRECWIRYGTRELHCRYVGGLEGATRGEMPERAVIRLVADDPYWYETSEEEQDILVDGTITNTGSAECFPVIKFVGPGLLWSRLRNLETGLIVLFPALSDAYEMIDGEVVTLDLRPTRKTLTSNVFGSVLYLLQRGFVGYYSNLSRWALAPGSQVVATDFTPSSVLVSWTPRHWGID
jgi:hypothetical protein